MCPAIALDRERAAGKASYERLITLNVRHEYYNGADASDWRDRPCPDLVVRPTAETATRLASLGLLVRGRPDGLDILYTGDQAAVLKSRIEGLLAAFPAGLPPEVESNLFAVPFLFTIGLANPDFLNFTDMWPGFGCGRRALKLSNLHVANLDDSDRSDGAGDKASADLVIDWRRHIDLTRHHHRPEAPAQTTAARAPQAAALHVDRLAAVWHHLSAAEAAAAAADRVAVHTNVSAFPFALLDLHIVRPADMPASEHGLFPVAIHPDAQRRSSSKAGGFIQPLTYNLCFKARQTRWRYFIAARTGALPSDLDIVDNQESDPVRFARLDPAPVLPGGADSICLAAQSPIMLRQRPAARFSLQGTPRAGRGRPRALIDPLPVPSVQAPTAIRAPAAEPEDEDPQQGSRDRDMAQTAAPWSDIYVFV